MTSDIAVFAITYFHLVVKSVNLNIENDGSKWIGFINNTIYHSSNNNIAHMY